jgi:hypothetical protein
MTFAGLLLLLHVQQPPKKKDKEPEETLTRIAIVNEDRCGAYGHTQHFEQDSSCLAHSLRRVQLLPLAAASCRRVLGLFLQVQAQEM